MSRSHRHSHGGSRSHHEAQDRSALTPALFRKFQELIYQEAGIWLAVHKHALLTGRVARRLRLLGLNSMEEYHDLITQPDQLHERAVMIDCITTNETHFFREPRHFDFLSQNVFPKWQHEAATGARPTRLRVWTGESLSLHRAVAHARAPGLRFPSR